MVDMPDEELQALYAWIDEIPLSRQKKNIARDFSDGVLAAEVVRHYLPKLVDEHNYTPASSSAQKLDNWRTLNRKVFSRLNFSIPDDLLTKVASATPGVIEFILHTLRSKIEKYLENRSKQRQRHNSYSEDSPYYDSSQLVPSYDNTLDTWQQDTHRHPGPAASELMDADYPTNHQQHHNHPLLSKIPRPVKKLDMSAQKNSVSAPTRSTTLPPINSSQGETGAGSSRGHSNPERNKYAYNPRNPPPKMMKQVDNSTGIRLKLAEKDQRILESQEYIQFLQMKVTRLEHLVEIKDLKITDLKRQLDIVKMERHHPLQRKH